MGLSCKCGAKECTACRRCFSATVCEICGKKIPEGRICYELSEETFCGDCVEIIIAEGDEVCSLCGDAISEGERMLLFEEHRLCPVCIRISERKKDYV